MKYIYDLDKEELCTYLTTIGEPKFRAEQIFTALQNGTQVADISNISKSLREKLSQDFYCTLPTIEKQLKSKDGTIKYLLRLQDDSLIECVLLVQDYGRTVCVSSQVGCKMKCAFCASGGDGFIRNLTAGEMLSQVLICAPVTNIVIMGSGEPFDNFDNVMKFLELTTVGARHISVSTAGLPDKIRAFADKGLQVNLCISLHAPSDEIRKTIMPIATRHPMSELISAARYFFHKTKRRVIFEYTLIDNTNCEPEHANQLIKLLRGAGFACHINLINLNKGHGNLNPPPKEKALKFMDTVIKGGLSCTMRKSKGSDIAGACGQLRTKHIKEGG